MTKNEKDIKMSVQVAVEDPESKFSGNSTYSTLFLIPAYNITLDDNLMAMFINTFVNDYELKHAFKRPLFLLLSTGLEDEEARTVYTINDTLLRKNPNFVFDYVVGTEDDTFLIMYVFECPDKYSADYDNFLAGQYSNFSKDYKRFFHEEIPGTDGTIYYSPIYGAINKTERFRKQAEHIIGQTLEPTQEFWGKVVPELDVFRYPKRPTKTPTSEPFKIQTPEP